MGTLFGFKKIAASQSVNDGLATPLLMSLAMAKVRLSPWSIGFCLAWLPDFYLRGSTSSSIITKSLLSEHAI